MSHITFELIEGKGNILVDHISRLRFMGLYDMLNPEERGKDFEHSMLMNYPPLQLNKKYP